MHTEGEPIDYDTLSEMGYERRDVNYRALTKWIVAFFVLAIAFALAAYVFYLWLAPRQVEIGRTSFVPKTRRTPPAPNPLLQNNVETKVDIQRMRQDEVSLLTSYGWVDQTSGVVRMPIERAKDLLIQRGASLGPSTTAPVRRPDTSPRDVTGQSAADKPPGGANAGDTSPRTQLPTGNAARDPRRNGGVTNAPTGSDSAPSNASQGIRSAPGQPGVTGPTNEGQE